MRFLTVCCSILLWQTAVARPYNAESERWLQKLDSVVTMREEINQRKREQVDQLRQLRQFLSVKADIYKHNSSLYDECFTFDSELAMELADENLSIAREMKDYDGVYEWTIKRSFIMASTGQLLESAKVLEGFPTGQVSHKLQLQYYGQMQYLNSHLQQYSWSKSLKEEYQARGSLYTDSIYSILQPGDADYAWYSAWTDMNTPRLPEAAAQLKTVVDEMSLTSRNDAMLAYVLAKMYERMEEHDNYLQYMARSAIADLQSANQDIASLEELAQVLYNDNVNDNGNGDGGGIFSSASFHATDLQRAYAYINVCLETARLYNNLVRTVSIARVQDSILKSYQNRDSVQRKRLIVSLVIMIVLLVVTVAAAIMIWRQNSRLAEQRARLHENNLQLSRHREALAEANNALAEANDHLVGANNQLLGQNAVKEEYIGFVFAICSNYISKLDEYRKDINRKAKVKQWNEILAMTEKQTILGDEIKEFYHNFDTIFLHVYPTFIEEFNALLLPEEQITPRNGELLNTDLRIHALVRLGITDSTKIADFLHCSAQTVYNNRMKVRNKAIDKDLFMDKVRELCTPR